MAQLTGTARRQARWGALTEDGKAAGAAELGEVAGDRADLLAGVAGISLGTAEGKGEEYVAQGQAVPELCRMAGAGESLISRRAKIGRERAEVAGRPAFSRPGSAPHGDRSAGRVRAAAFVLGRHLSARACPGRRVRVRLALVPVRPCQVYGELQ